MKAMNITNLDKVLDKRLISQPKKEARTVSIRSDRWEALLRYCKVKKITPSKAIDEMIGILTEK